MYLVCIWKEHAKQLKCQELSEASQSATTNM